MFPFPHLGHGLAIYYSSYGNAYKSCPFSLQLVNIIEFSFKLCQSWDEMRGDSAALKWPLGDLTNDVTGRTILRQAHTEFYI